MNPKYLVRTFQPNPTPYTIKQTYTNSLVRRCLTKVSSRLEKRQRQTDPCSKKKREIFLFATRPFQGQGQGQSHVH